VGCIARENPQKENAWFGMVHKNPRIGIGITIWSTYSAGRNVFCYAKRNAPEITAKKGEIFPCCNVDFLLCFCFGEVGVEFSIVNMLT
jgi:hypothetical protein